ncbi:MAG: cation diffusion facilitator family transporter [Spirochaetota bacterium]|nr:cation diffusion facilitator family transporter [Spirochaetota bacterium]
MRILKSLGHHDHGCKRISSRKRLGLVILLNSVITVTEYIGGILSGSLALISDAGHNLSDVLSLMLGYAGERVSEIKPGRKYSFGLKRFETLIALANALSLVAIGIYILYEAAERYANPVSINIKIVLPIAFIGFLGNLFSILILNIAKESNLNMKAAFLHLFYDAISSIAVMIVGIVLYYTNWLWIDIGISILIVFMIIWSSISIIGESLRIFLQGVPDNIDIDAIYASMLAIDNIESIHGLHVWSVSSSEVFLSCHICLNNFDLFDSDDIIINVNSMLEEKFGIGHTTLQLENRNLCNMDGGCCK